jgi:hypothetical protein
MCGVRGRAGGLVCTALWRRQASRPKAAASTALCAARAVLSPLAALAAAPSSRPSSSSARARRHHPLGWRQSITTAACRRQKKGCAPSPKPPTQTVTLCDRERDRERESQLKQPRRQWNPTVTVYVQQLQAAYNTHARQSQCGTNERRELASKIKRASRVSR